MGILTGYILGIVIMTIGLRVFINDSRNIVLGILWPITVLMVVSAGVSTVCCLIISKIIDLTGGETRWVK